jgi:hypothetical protein
MTTMTVAPGFAETHLHRPPLRESVTANARSRSQGRPKSDNIVGRFRSGRLVGNSIEELPNWRVTTADQRIASALAQRLGGTSGEWPATDGDRLEVLTESPAVRVVLDGPQAITSSLMLGDHGGLGSPRPTTTVLFRLADALELGMFQLRSASWEMAAIGGELEDQLTEVGGHAICELSLELVEFTTRVVPQAGRNAPGEIRAAPRLIR